MSDCAPIACPRCGLNMWHMYQLPAPPRPEIVEELESRLAVADHLIDWAGHILEQDQEWQNERFAYMERKPKRI
jgi:hypothetical protein